MNILKTFRKPYLSLFLATLVLFVSCEQYDQSNSKSNIENQEIDSNLFQKSTINLFDDEAYIELISIRNSFTQRVSDNNISILDLKEAYLSNDTELLKTLFGYSEIEIELMDERIQYLGEKLKTKYPALFGNISDDCLGCNDNEKIEEFFDNYDPLTSFTTNMAKEEPACADPISYVLCLIVCTTTGPFIYWPCAYLCYRTLC